MKMDLELDQWREQWQSSAETPPLSGLSKRVTRQSRLMRIALAGDMLVTIVIGGGVSLLGESVLFAPLRRAVAGRVFRPFAGLTDIVPAALGEEVVVHGALALARKRLPSESLKR